MKTVTVRPGLTGAELTIDGQVVAIISQREAPGTCNGLPVMQSYIGVLSSEHWLVFEAEEEPRDAQAEVKAWVERLLAQLDTILGPSRDFYISSGHDQAALNARALREAAAAFGPSFGVFYIVLRSWIQSLTIGNFTTKLTGPVEPPPDAAGVE